MKKIFSLATTVATVAIMALLFMPINVSAKQGDVNIGVLTSNGEIDLGNDGLTAGININDGMFEDSIEAPTFDNVLEIERKGIIVEYEILDNLKVSGAAGVQASSVSGLIELSPDYALGYQTDTENGFCWQVGAEYSYGLENGITPFISGAYSQGKNAIEGATLSMLGIGITLPDAINEIGGLLSPDISSSISGDVNVKKFKALLGIKKDFIVGSVILTPYIAASYLRLNVETDISVSATDGWDDVTLSLNAENESDKAIGAVVGLSTSSETGFFKSSVEMSFRNERDVSAIGMLCFNF